MAEHRPQHAEFRQSRNATAPIEADSSADRRRTWRLNRFSLIPAILAIMGVLTLTYPVAASWISQYNQSKIVQNYQSQVDTAQPEKEQQLAEAREYNKALSVGAVLKANTNVPTGAGENGSDLDYNEILVANDHGLMGRIKIPSISVDLPIYHGTSDTTLLEGIGHLEGTSLPVGGADTRTVLTGHRGLAEARMFTDLDRVQPGDTFVLEVFGEVLTYKVYDKKVVEPEDTESLHVEKGRDLATLVTCTPLGINSHRILLTGERVYPTPQKDIEDAGKKPEVPYFPWWIIWTGASFVGIGVYIWWSGRPTGAKSSRTNGANTSGDNTATKKNSVESN